MINKDDCKDIKLLYAEDDLNASEATVRILNKFFTHVTVVYDGLEGLTLAKKNKYDLIITDINMPKLNGLEMLAEIKKFNKNIYSIVITAYSDQKTFLDSIKIGVKGYIVKPMDINQFIETMETAVTYINAHSQINILQQYKDIVDRSSIVSKSDPSGKITFVNDKFCEITGYTKQELMNKQHSIIRHPDMDKSIFKNLWHTIKNKEIWTGQVKNRSKNGSSYYVDATICPILDENNNIVEYIGLRNDITQMLNPKKQLSDILKITKYPFLAMLKIKNFSIIEHLYSEKVIEDMLELFSKMLYTIYLRVVSLMKFLILVTENLH
jgi:PAS domain S-box-containing protein